MRLTLLLSPSPHKKAPIPHSHSLCLIDDVTFPNTFRKLGTAEELNRKYLRTIPQFKKMKNSPKV